MKWYQNNYRRHLLDTHINDTDNEYLSKYSAEEYFKYLQKANVTNAMIYLQAHTGLCNFETSVSKTHKFFSKNIKEVNKLIDLCKSNGIKVVGYYSLIFNNQAVYDHPDWEMINEDGTTWRDHGQRYGLCCPNNNDYRQFVIDQLHEIKEANFDLDGIFFDMPYWEMLCHCPSCQKRFMEETGMNLPSEISWDDECFKEFVRRRQIWMGEFTKFVREQSEKILTGVTVEFNFAAVIGCDWLAGSTEVINEECEFTGGDLYGDLYDHSFTAKYYYGITKNQPFEYMVCRCNKNLREHTVSKNEETLESEIMLSCMHHGASLVIDAINPDGSVDMRVAERIGKVFEKEIPYEPFLDKGYLYGDVAVFFDSKTQFEHHEHTYNKKCAIQTSRTLIENHIPFNIISNYHLNNLNQYKLIVASCLEDFKNDEVLKFIDYVKNGGTLYLSGHNEPRLLKEFFDGKITGETFGDSKYSHVYKGYDEVQCYVYPVSEKYKGFMSEFNDKYPLPVTYKLPIFTFEKGNVEAKLCLPYTDPDNNTIYASIHSNPPGKLTEYPGIVTVNYGKGKVIYSLAPIENDTRYNFKDIFMNIVNDVVTPLIKVETSKYVESILFKDGENYILNLFDLNYANEAVIRSFSINLDPNVYDVKEAISGAEISPVEGSFQSCFKKYISLIITKK